MHLKDEWYRRRKPAVWKVSKNLRTRSQADRDSSHGLFDTQTGFVAGGSSLSTKRAFCAYLS